MGLDLHATLGIAGSMTSSGQVPIGFEVPISGTVTTNYGNGPINKASLLLFIPGLGGDLCRSSSVWTRSFVQSCVWIATTFEACPVYWHSGPPRDLARKDVWAVGIPHLFAKGVKAEHFASALTLHLRFLGTIWWAMLALGRAPMILTYDHGGAD